MENKATKRTNRLGRGLSALIPDISTEIDKKDIITIDLKNIYPNQDQPRRVFDEEKITHIYYEVKKQYYYKQFKKVARFYINTDKLSKKEKNYIITCINK